MIFRTDASLRSATTRVFSVPRECDGTAHNLSHCWGVILAGGDGTRLRPLTRVLAGDDRPKQFCKVIGTETLLDQTLRRVGRLIPAERTRIVITGGHKRFFNQHEERANTLIVQPMNRGTAPAILYSLMSVGKHDPEARIAFFPSDHYFRNDAIFMNGVASAFRAIARRPELTVLLGIVPDRPEVEYGWIEPADSIDGLDDVSLFQVSAFWEKPTLRTAEDLLMRGCLWNSFITVGTVGTLIHLFRTSIPALYQAFEAILPSIGTPDEIDAMQQLYSQLSAGDFSGEVLRVCPKQLTVLPLVGAGWVDIGSTDRAMAVLARI